MLLGLDAEFGNKTSTADDAIQAGIEIAIEEVNRSGGVLGGRPLQLVIRDNRGIPARGVDNLRELASLKDMTAVFGSKFSAVLLAQVALAHELRVPLLDPWAAADGIVNHGYKPSYTFRLSLRDGWAMPFLLKEAQRRGFKKIGVLLPNGDWGRSNRRAVEEYLAANPSPFVVKFVGFEWSDTSLADEYLDLLRAGAEAVLVVGNEPEVALLVTAMKALPRTQWRPLLSHWGAAAGNLPALTGPGIFDVDLSIVQTFSFIRNPTPRAKRVLEAAMALLKVSEPRGVVSPPGVAHAYDLTHLLARAIDKAGTTDREKVRDALEKLGPYEGLVKHYHQPFSRDRHEALGPEQLFMARWRSDGVLVPSSQ